MANSEVIRVALADDHRNIHELVNSLLKTVEDIQLIAHASNGDEAIIVCEQHTPDILLLDVMMPVVNGIEVCEYLLDRVPNLKILVLSSFGDDESVRAMLNKGALGYVLKSSLGEDLIDTIRATYKGNSVLSSGLIKQLITPSTTEHFDLTERELAVLRLLGQGKSLDEIAEMLIISRSTVKYHLNNILAKMHVETRAEAILVAAKANLI